MTFDPTTGRCHYCHDDARNCDCDSNPCTRCNDSECSICPDCDEPSCGFCDCSEDETLSDSICDYCEQEGPTNSHGWCKECDQSEMFTACAQCDWFGIPIDEEGNAAELCDNCENELAND